jgi:hypothetical protein
MQISRRVCVRALPVPSAPLVVSAVILGLLVLAPAAVAETWVDSDRTIAIDPARGVDRDVDYKSLVVIGPWDDRNYQLTKEDLGVLADNESELTSPIPAFFRVEYRKAWTEQGFEPFAQYPLSAFNEFRQRLGGYLIRGTHYRKATRLDGQYFVNTDSPMPGSPEAPAGSPGFLSGEKRVTNPTGAAESAIAISPTDTSQVVAGSNGPLGGQRMHYSQDGGQAWAQVNLPLGGTCCDPTVGWSSDGRYAYTATLGQCSGGCRLWFYRSDNGGATWTSLEDESVGNPRRELAQGADREYLHVDQSPVSPYKDNIYMAWHRGNVMRFGKSEDFGNTWTVTVFPGGAANRGIAGDITTDRDGNIYYAWPTFDNTVRVRISTDGGDTWGEIRDLMPLNSNFLFPIPAVESREVSNYASAATDLTTGPFSGRVYFAWADTTEPEAPIPAQNHAWIRVAYTPNGGQGWKIRTPHETGDLEEVDRWQPFIAVGPDGTVHVVFYDTRREPDRTAADLFYSFSMDGGDTWSSPERITTEMSPNINDGFEFGDYSGMDIVMNDLIAIFTDNRNESGGSGDSVDVYAAGIAAGGLGGAGRVPGSQAVPGQPLVLGKSGADIDFMWAAACGTVTDYAVYEGPIGDFENSSPLLCSTGGAISTTLTPGAGDRFYLIVPTSNDAVEGSYGQSSDGLERAPSSSACYLQTIEFCE